MQPNMPSTRVNGLIGTSSDHQTSVYLTSTRQSSGRQPSDGQTSSHFSSNLSDYDLLENLHNSDRTQVYQAIHRPNQQAVILKFLSNPQSSARELKRFRHQYTLTQLLDHPNILKIEALARYQTGDALVMLDRGYDSLKDYLKDHPVHSPSALSISQVLTIGLQLAEMLHYLNQQRIIHKDIKPGNLLIHPATLNIQLIDFGLATNLPQGQREISPPKQLEGTLAYMAPEQTGRMNRGIDGRVDIYSVGVVLYELLTGQCPFLTTDPLNLIYAQMAEIPVPPCERSPLVPPMVSEIVLKLLAKNAEDRYQSGLGLKHDLEHCLTQWQEQGEIANFELGQRDMSNRFHISETLYGREADVQTLLDAFERVSKGPSELLLVAGLSGSGKTTVVHKAHTIIARKKGYFIQGKFDQFNRNRPFSAFVQAFRQLMGQLLGESDATLTHWKTKILTAMGNNGQVLMDVIPELKSIIGPQPSVPKLSGSATKNRFNLLLGQFIQVFTTPDHPLVLFLDDLQWADSDSLALFKQLMVDDSGYLLVLGAYRDNEVGPSHPLMVTLNEMHQRSIAWKILTLKMLSEADINYLVADSLQCSVAVALPFSQLVYQKTQGNPLFATQLLQGLYNDGRITFNAETGYWQCDWHHIGELAMTDDVVEFMVRRIQSLPHATQTVLTMAACLGNQFDLVRLAIVCEQTQEDVAKHIRRSLQAGLVVPATDTYTFIQEPDPAVNPNLDVTTVYHFLHDRVQQAAYAQIPEPQKDVTHYRIGTLLWKQIPDDQLEERIFELVSQLNKGISPTSQQHERDMLAQLNLVACRRAKNTTTYQVSRDYAETGLSLLGNQAWQRHYPLTLQFHELAAELASLCGDFNAMNQSIEQILNHATSVLDQVIAYQTRVLSKISQNKPTEAIDIAQGILKYLGFEFPTSPTQADHQREFDAINQLMGNQAIDSLIDLPIMVDNEKIAAVRIITNVLGAACNTGSPLLPLLVALSIKLSIQYGNTNASALCYASYSLLNFKLLKDIETGVRFGELALNLVSTLNAKTYKPAVLYMAACFILHRKTHIRNMLPISKEGYAVGLEVGDLDYVGYSTQAICINSFWCGQFLETLEDDVQGYRTILRQINQIAHVHHCQIFWQTILNLRGLSETTTALEGHTGQETQLLDSLTASKDYWGLFCFYLYKGMLCYTFWETQAAESLVTRAKDYLISGMGTVCEPIFYFYDSLTALANINRQQVDRTDVLQRVEYNQTVLRQEWALYAPMNHQHKVDLVDAEKYRVLGQKANAIEQYDQAIQGAKENDYIQEEALANELAAKFYLDWGKEKMAVVYMQEAYDCYARWGAKAKTTDLENKYPQLLKDILTPRLATAPPFTGPFTTSISNYASTMWGLHASDFAPIMKSAQTLVHITDFPTLIRQLMQLTLISSGAQTCIIAYQDGDGQWTVQGNRIADAPNGRSQSYPSHLINWTKNTRVTTLLDGQSPLKIIDPYLLEHQPQSAFCTPILKRETVLGVLYLEHPQAKHIFTQRDQTILAFLCAQAAIALDYAALHRTTQTLPSGATYFTTLLLTIPQMAWIEDANGHILATNAAFAQAFGKDFPDDLLGQSLAEWAPPQLMEQLQAQDMPATAQSNVSHVTLVDSDNESQCYDVVRTPVQDPEGKLTGSMGIWLTMRSPLETDLPNSSHDERSNTNEGDDNLSEEQLIQLMLSKVPIEQTSIVDQVKVALIELLPQGLCSADAVAKHIGVSARTLRRRLKAEETSFKDELAQLRLAFAKHYLTQSELTNQNIATLLGYDAPGSFIRAFTTAIGMAPQEFRKLSSVTKPAGLSSQN